MNKKSPETACFYLPAAPSGDGRQAFESLPTTGSPWGPDSQHGGPPAALLSRAIEQLGDGVVGRFTMELLGPVPMGPLATSAEVIRPGRTVQLAAAGLYDAARDRRVATGQAWLFPAAADGPAPEPVPPTSAPETAEVREFPPGWGGGYLDAVEWRWVDGAIQSPGRSVVWMRTPDLVAGEPISPLQRLLVCADSASGASSVLDPREWAFLNTELTVHVLRPPEGEWLLLDAESTLSTGSVGLATADIHDRRGLVARSNQALLVRPR
jgi:acyl-coenzyme A thioesterase PaaI-like protein